ncbi:MAG: hypothetical protein WDO73_26615 [Ignavibacteriota bacterium]
MRTSLAAFPSLSSPFSNPPESSYGRKGHLRAIWLLQQDGGNPIEAHTPNGTKYSFQQNLDNGRRCWKLRRVDGRDDDGVPVTTRGVFVQVVMDCLVA